jgi:hypothetical protein
MALHSIPRPKALRRTLVRGAGLLLPLLLAGCLSFGSNFKLDPTSEWQKGGKTAEATQADLSECKAFAREATETDSDIDSDIIASRGGDWQSSGNYTARTQATRLPTGRRTDRIVERCMTAKGYRPAD